MEAFLSQVARIYTENDLERLSEYCFVFPNRRSGTFFRRYLAEHATAAKRVVIMPRIATLNELVSENASLIEASVTEQLFVLYREYSRYFEGIDFERFMFWGSVLLDDFNDVDMNLIEPTGLFVNVERWREIKSNYLTPIQVEIIRRFWGDELPDGNVEEFWKHTTEMSDPESVDRFMKLWEVMNDLYTDFETELRRRGLATRGMLMREACRGLGVEKPDGCFGMKRYIFVGFDLPTAGELTIFSALQKADKADFYWDFDTPLDSDKKNRLVRIMTDLKRDFASRYPLPERDDKSFPEIILRGIPSFTGQAKWSSRTLEEWCEKKVITDADNAIDTAVVLPDEALFVPMIHSVPPRITAINVTMGFPMKLTPVAGLLGSIVSLHLRSRHGRNGKEYYYEDVELVIGNPLVRLAMAESCEGLHQKIRRDRLYNVGSRMVADEFGALSVIFDDPTEDTAEAAFRYMQSVAETLLLALEHDPAYAMETFFLKSYLMTLTDLFESVKLYKIEMRQSTFISLAERMMSVATVNFEGEPLKGLQIMGVLETRALDFKNLIITSMNEKVFPRKAQKRSFIPDALRTAYGLPTSDIQEMQYGYYFIRMLARAKNVEILYDSRQGLMSSSEISRYVTQLMYLYPESNVVHRGAYFKGVGSVPEPVTLPKSEALMKRLLTLTDPECRRPLSASALKTYLTCPLQFCLRYVMRLSTDDEITDYMEASTLGTIVHAVAERLYNSLQSADGAPVTVTARDIDNWLGNRRIVERHVTELINKEYNHTATEKDLTPLKGETRVLGVAIVELILAMLALDRELTPFVFEDAEAQMPALWRVNDELTVPFGQVIDRIDKVNGKRRIVDYKTGDEKSDAKLDDMFKAGECSGDAKSVFQVLLYCELYRLNTGNMEPLLPVIYNLRKVFDGSFDKIKVDGEVLNSYDDVAAKFREGVDKLLTEIFNPDVPFRQTTDSENCRFCSFKDICNRRVPKKTW